MLYRCIIYQSKDPTANVYWRYKVTKKACYIQPEKYYYYNSPVSSYRRVAAYKIFTFIEEGTKLS